MQTCLPDIEYSGDALGLKYSRAPNYWSNVMEFIASLSKDSYVNIMDQYHPANKAARYPEINRCITSKELEEAVKIAEKEGLHR